jgi:hypothetical protein
MTPTDLLEARVAALLAADTTTLAEATFLHLHLVGANFNPLTVQTVAELTLLSGGGLDAKATTSAVQVVYRDPVSGNWVISIAEPAGGWQWVASTVSPLPTLATPICTAPNC